MLDQKTKRQKRFIQKSRIKSRVKHLQVCWEPNPIIVGKLFHTPALCSCWMCGNPRKYFNEKTIQERSSEQTSSWLDD